MKMNNCLVLYFIKFFLYNYCQMFSFKSKALINSSSVKFSIFEDSICAFSFLSTSINLNCFLTAYKISFFYLSSFLFSYNNFSFNFLASS